MVPVTSLKKIGSVARLPKISEANRTFFWPNFWNLEFTVLVCNVSIYRNYSNFSTLKNTNFSWILQKCRKIRILKKFCQVSDQMTTIGKYFVRKHQVQVNKQSLQVCGKFICFHIVKENSFRTLIQCFLMKLFCFHSLFFVTGS